MIAHFNGFSSATMRVLGEELSAERLRRRDLIEQTRSYTSALLESARRLRFEAETERRQVAAQDADTRRLFTSELRSEVHALRTRFELARRDVAADFQQMVSELRAARESIRSRPAHPEKPVTRHTPRAATRPASPQEAAMPEEHVETRIVEIKAPELKPVAVKTVAIVMAKPAMAKPAKTKLAKTKPAAPKAAAAKPVEAKPPGREKKTTRKSHG